MADALIWGASGGIGQALTQLLIDEGWRVFAAAREESKIPQGVYRSYRFESSNRAMMQDIAIYLAHETTGIDLWVYTAGELRAELMKKMPPTTWDEVLNSNLNGAFLTASQTLHLVKNGGQVAFIGAYVDHLILPKMGAYAVAKSGLETLVSVLQKENRKLNFTLVKPGAVDTPFWENAPFKMPANAKLPEQVAQAMLTQCHTEGRGVLAL